tara:strand:+ start:448 stop:675 length:228 start_codon:yes stop_codon:yes gene_type:complete
MNNTAGTALAAKSNDEAQFARITSAIFDETVRLARLEVAAGATYAEAFATAAAKAAEAAPAYAAIALEMLATATR